jgi:S1-C subfamily serine protease
MIADKIRIAVVATILAIAAEETASAEEATKGSWIDSWRNATVALGRIEKVPFPGPSDQPRDVFIVVGTGVIMGLPGQVMGIPWLVTAKHVFSKPEDHWNPTSIQVRFAWFENKGIQEHLGVRLNLKEGAKPLWIVDPDPSVDLAAIPLKVLKADAGRDSLSGITVENFVRPDDLYEGARVMVFGYPGAVGPAFWTRALLRSGAIAWVHPIRPAEEPALIDAMIYPGNSGGPVFREPTGMTRDGNFQIGGAFSFLGIVSEGRRQPTPVTVGGNPIQAQGPAGQTFVMSESWMGIGVVEPASRVRRLLEIAAKQVKH